VISVEEAIAISDEAERAGLLKSGGLPKRNEGCSATAANAAAM